MPKAGDIYISVEEYPPMDGINVAYHMCFSLIEPYEDATIGEGRWRCNMGFYYAKDDMLMFPLHMNNGHIMFNPDSPDYICIGSLDGFSAAGVRGSKDKPADIAEEIHKIRDDIMRDKL